MYIFYQRFQHIPLTNMTDYCYPPKEGGRSLQKVVLFLIWWFRYYSTWIRIHIAWFWRNYNSFWNWSYDTWKQLFFDYIGFSKLILFNNFSGYPVDLSACNRVIELQDPVGNYIRSICAIESDYTYQGARTICYQKGMKLFIVDTETVYDSFGNFSQ